MQSEKAVHRRAREQGIAEEIADLGRAPVRDDERREALVASTDDLVEVDWGVTGSQGRR
jgi:hypothetical protein